MKIKILVTFLCLSGLHLTNAQENPCEGLNSGFKPDPEDCTGYFSCQGGIAWKKQCPDELVYNPIGPLCDYPQNVPECSNILTCKGNEGIKMMPSRSSCRKFLICRDENAIEQDCADGLWFDETDLNCQPVCDVECFINSCPVEDGDKPHFIADKNCQKYHVCLKGQPIEQSCADGLHWSEELEECATPEVAECNNCPDGETTGTTSADGSTTVSETTTETTVDPTANP